MKKMLKHFLFGVLSGLIVSAGLFSWAFVENRVAVSGRGVVEVPASAGKGEALCFWKDIWFARGSYIVVHERSDRAFALHQIVGQEDYVFHDAWGWATDSWLGRSDRHSLVADTCARRVHWAEEFNELS